MVGAHAGDGGEHDGGHGGGNGHLDGEIGGYLLVAQDVGQEGHQQHATTNAEQARQKTCAQTEDSEFNNQKGVEHHAKDSGGTEAATSAQSVAALTGAKRGCLQVPPDRHPEPGVQVGEGSQALGSSDAR